MGKLVYYQMRIFSIVLLVVISSIIVFSYVFIPARLSLTVNHFYSDYWYLLTKLFVTAAVFLLFAYSVEREWMATSWLQRVIAFCLIGLFVKEFVELVRLGDLLLAFIS